MFLQEHFSYGYVRTILQVRGKFMRVMNLGVKINFNLPADENAKAGGCRRCPVQSILRYDSPRWPRNRPILK
jgi:hypothetical protein